MIAPNGPSKEQSTFFECQYFIETIPYHRCDCIGNNSDLMLNLKDTCQRVLPVYLRLVLNNFCCFH